jgi:hypothetical protein
MKITQMTPFATLLTLGACAMACGMLSTDLYAAEDKGGERAFESPDEAVMALKAATNDKDKKALHKLFGPGFRELLTGDEVQDANNADKFAAAVGESCRPVNESDDKIFIEIGTDHWPMPIPLVKADGKWHFDTVAGKEEIINRHIGTDELHAIGVARAYVTAQRQYASANSGAYALKFKSASGKKDGLYWETSANDSPSPFGPLVAEAHSEGYVTHKGNGPHPFHGYYFRILTRQGKDAPGGKMDYVTNGSLTGGFALVAYPENWDRSGIMTFIVNQDGKLYQKNLGEKTSRIAGSMKEYNPESGWTLVEESGVLEAVSEK